jgi:hypothetical protein
MKFLRNHWYDLGLIPLVCAAIYLAFSWNSSSVLLKLALANYIVIFWHQFEEYRFPGGEAAVTNLAMQPKAIDKANRYPLNQNNAMFINVIAAYGVYFLPILFPEVLWISFFPMLFGIAQGFGHEIITPRKIGSKIYSPGGLAALFGHTPLGIYWFYYTISNGLLSWIDVVFGLVYQILFIVVIMLKIGYGALADEESKYPFPDEEFERGGYAKRIRNLSK